MSDALVVADVPTVGTVLADTKLVPWAHGRVHPIGARMLFVLSPLSVGSWRMVAGLLELSRFTQACGFLLPSVDTFTKSGPWRGLKDEPILFPSPRTALRVADAPIGLHVSAEGVVTQRRRVHRICTLLSFLEGAESATWQRLAWEEWFVRRLWQVTSVVRSGDGD